jgi:hypothetical protein
MAASGLAAGGGDLATDGKTLLLGAAGVAVLLGVGRRWICRRRLLRDYQPVERLLTLSSSALHAAKRSAHVNGDWDAGGLTEAAETVIKPFMAAYPFHATPSYEEGRDNLETATPYLDEMRLRVRGLRRLLPLHERAWLWFEGRFTRTRERPFLFTPHARLHATLVDVLRLRAEDGRRMVAQTQSNYAHKWARTRDDLCRTVPDMSRCLEMRPIVARLAKLYGGLQGALVERDHQKWRARIGSVMSGVALGVSAVHAGKAFSSLSSPDSNVSDTMLHGVVAYGAYQSSNDMDRVVDEARVAERSAEAEARNHGDAVVKLYQDNILLTLVPLTPSPGHGQDIAESIVCRIDAELTRRIEAVIGPPPSDPLADLDLPPPLPPEKKHASQLAPHRTSALASDLYLGLGFVALSTLPAAFTFTF